MTKCPNTFGHTYPSQDADKIKSTIIFKQYALIIIIIRY